MLCQAEDLELPGYGCLDDFLQRVFGMARAELARMAVVREGHSDSVQGVSTESSEVSERLTPRDKSDGILFYSDTMDVR